VDHSTFFEGRGEQRERTGEIPVVVSLELTSRSKNLNAGDRAGVGVRGVLHLEDVLRKKERILMPP